MAVSPLTHKIRKLCLILLFYYGGVLGIVVSTSYLFYFFFCFFFFFAVERQISVLLIDKRVSVSVSGRFSHYAWTTKSAHSDFIRLRVHTCLAVLCQLHFWHVDNGLLCATAVNRRWNGHHLRVSTEN